MEHNKWIQDLVSGYYEWLRDNTIVSYDRLTDWNAINTPCVGLHNDTIEIYVKKEGDKILFSDDGETLWSLASYGINISKSPQRQKIVNSIQLNFGVRFEGDEIVSEATAETFNLKKHAFLQALQQISDLRMTAKHDVITMFSEEFRAFLDKEDIVYTPQFTLLGKSGLNFFFDFQIAGKKHETVIRTYNQINKSNVTDILFGINDIRETRQEATRKSMRCVVVINDNEKQPRKELLHALREYDCTPLLWTEQGKQWNKQTILSCN